MSATPLLLLDAPAPADSEQAASTPGPAWRGRNAFDLGLIGFVPIFSLICQLPMVSKDPGLVAMNTTAPVLLVLAGQYLLRQAYRRSLATAMTVCGYIWAAQFLTYWNLGPLPLIGGLCSELVYVIGSVGILGYPSDQSTSRFEKFVCGYIALSAGLQYSFAVVSSTPVQMHVAPEAWWVTSDTLVAHHGVTFTSLTTFAAIGPALFLAAVLVRTRKLAPMDKAVLLPVGFTAFLASVASVALGTDEIFAYQSDAWFLSSTTAALIPLSMVIVFGFQDKIHAGLANRLSHEFAQRRVSDDYVTQILRTELKDASLTIFFWSPERQRFEDEHEQRYDMVQNESGYSKRLFTSDGSPLALVIGSPFLRRYPRAVDTALNSSAIAIENSHLHKSLTEQLDEVTKSRARVAEAAMKERRRIERDLHDGVQQRLLALAMRIGTAEHYDREEKLRTLEWIRSELVSTVHDVRDLARGIHPAELRTSGLRSAIQSIAHELPLNIEVDITPDRTSETVEVTAYFIICEALANAVKHAEADSAKVIVKLDGGAWRVTVSDDGKGGATASNNGGLRGLADRTAAQRGTFSFTSIPGIGTEVNARLPIVVSN